MKNKATNIRSVLRNKITPAAFACALMLTSLSTSVYANDKKEVAASPVEVKYLGKVDKQPIIQININNLQQEELYVTLKDENGNNLYSEKIVNSFSKKFQFINMDVDNMKVTLSLYFKNSKKAQVFAINNITTIVEDIVLTKL